MVRIVWCTYLEKNETNIAAVIDKKHKFHFEKY